MRKNTNTKILHCNHVGARCCGTGSRSSIIKDGNKLWVVVRNDNSTGQSSSNKENAEAPIDGLECLLQVFSGVGGFACHHRNIFGPDDSETLMS